MDNAKQDWLARAEQRTGQLAARIDSYDRLVALARAHADPHHGERMPPWYRPVQVMKVAHGRQYCPAEYNACDDARCCVNTYESASIALGTVLALGDLLIFGCAMGASYSTALASAVAVFLATVYACALHDRRIIWEQHVLAPRQAQLEVKSETKLVEAYIGHELDQINDDLTGPNSELNRLREEAARRWDRMNGLKWRLLRRLKKDNDRKAIQLALRRLLRAMGRLEDSQKSLEQHHNKIRSLLNECRDRILDPLADISLLRETGELIEAVDSLAEQSERAVIDSIAELHRRMLGLGQQLQALAEHSTQALAELPGFDLEDQLQLIEAHAEETA